MKKFVRIFPLDPKYFEPGQRLKLERFEDEQNCTLTEEIVWPEKVNDPDANHIRETLDSICLTPEQRLWLSGVLAEMNAIKDDED